MPEIEGGAVFWARQTIESEIFFKKPDKWFKIWFYLVLKAKWKDEKGLKRGQCYMKYAWITDETGANRNEIDHCIRWLKRAKQIATQKATRGFILTIRNYERFQDPGNYRSDTESDMKSDTEATQKRHRSDRILNKGNKGNKGNKEKERKKERFTPPKIEDVVLYFTSRGYTEKTARKAYDYYNEADWHDSKGNKVKNWKQKMIANWFKDENKPELKARNFQQEYNFQSAKAFLERRDRAD